ncbi:MAG TPA: hypothetical protein VIJ57_15330 [Hanamia sp.]
MKTPLNAIRFFAVFLLIVILFSNCGKDADATRNRIQQGQTTIQINAIKIGNSLQVRYNNVIDAPINVTVTFHLDNGQNKNISLKIPAGYQHLQSWGGDNYINTFDYSGYNDSTGNASTPVIDGSWNVSSIEITAVSCPDKKYGFKVLTGADNWSFYLPTNPMTTLRFIVNKDTVSYADYDFNANGSLYRNNLKAYSFILYGLKVNLYSGVAEYPLQPGMTMKIPAMVYYWNSRNYGSQPDDRDSASNGSTIQFTITTINGAHFDAAFSGKLWSSRQADTLFISEGEIHNALLPGVVDY